MLLDKIKALVASQSFSPGLIGVFINPFYIARSGLRDAIAHFSPNLSGRMLDVGCGLKPYRSLFVVDEYVGLDIDSDASRQRGVADYFYGGHVFPFDSAGFDAVLCNQVLEHVFNPDDFVSEMFRVLKSDGKLLLTVPFVWDEHEQPYDYARYSTFGLVALLEKAGFEIVEHTKLAADVSAIAQLINLYIYKTTASYPRWIRGGLLLTVMAFFNIVGLVGRRVFPPNPDLFLDHIIFAVKKS